MEQLPPLHITIVEANSNVAQALRAVFQGNHRVASVDVLGDLPVALQRFADGDSNALVIDIFSMGTEAGIGFIQTVRETAKHVPICLVGTTEQLTLMPNIDAYWRNRFKHYYKLQTDLAMSSLGERVGQMCDLLAMYLLSRMASMRLRDVRALLEQPVAQGKTESERHEIKEAIAVAEQALRARQREQFIEFVIPGFEGKDLQVVVQDTIRKASLSLERSASVNKALLMFGGVLVAAAFLVASYRGSWEAVTFGGFGLAGIIASLITNPLKGIASTARRLVQIQVAYIGFLHVLGTFGSYPRDEDGGIRQMQALSQTIGSVLEALEKHCQ